MAKYVRRRLYSRRKGTRSSRRRSYRRGGILKKLARSVRKVRRLVNIKVQRLNLHANYEFTVSEGAALFNAVPLCNYASQNLLFGTAADDLTNNSVRHISTSIDCLVEANTEPDNINFTVFIVSLKDEAASLLDLSNGYITGLTNGLHYVKNDGLVMVNPKYFHIHKAKRFTTGNFTAALTSGAAVGAKGLCRFFWKQRIMKTVKNPAGNWRDLVSPRDPSQNYYMIFFNNNSALDLENPQVQMNVVSTFRG